MISIKPNNSDKCTNCIAPSSRTENIKRVHHENASNPFLKLPLDIVGKIIFQAGEDNQANTLRRLSCVCRSSREEYPFVLKNLNAVTIDISNNNDRIKKDLTQNPHLFVNIKKIKLTGIEHEIPRWVFRLPSIKKLDVSGNENLEDIPETVKNLTGLVELNLSNTAIKTLPDSLATLKEISHINLGFCKNLKDLPSVLSSIKSLKELNLSGYGNWQSVRTQEFNWARHYFYCDQQELMLPESIGDLHMEILILKSASNLTHLPDSISKCTRLKYIDVQDTKVSNKQIKIRGCKIVGGGGS